MNHFSQALIILWLFLIRISCSYDQLDSFSDSLLREMMSRMTDSRVIGNDFDLTSMDDYQMNLASNGGHPQQQKEKLKSQRAKEHGGKAFRIRHDGLLGREPSIRDQEYLEHSSLFGHQYVQGGAGEGYQRLKPDGSMQNVQVVKTDVLPAYCNPPNPCPLGYTGEDGCLEDFVNTAAFSQEYQASQECMCDTEHMFDCPGTTRENEIDALARSIQNEGIMDSTLNRLMQNMQVEGEHKNLVAKKYFLHKPANPYLEGEKLPVVAKKTPKVLQGA